MSIVDSHGNPIQSAPKRNPELAKARQELATLRRQILRAKYDAAQTVTGNELHWQGADHLDPHTAASLSVRKTLRSRSRYEVIENNPFLKGVILTISNDFVGTGPKLEITDQRISPDRRTIIENRFKEWFHLRRMRQKLWRARIAKIVDGETFLRAYTNRNNRKRYPVTLDFQVLEADRVSSETIGGIGSPLDNEVDGVRFDEFENPTEYFILRTHPGASLLFAPPEQIGTWTDERFIIHWFRQDRGWLRGVPETTPSLPLCSILRRYTLAVLRHSETAADFTAIMETDGPAAANAWADENGELLEDDPFLTFPIEAGMITNLPWGYKLRQLDAVPLGIQYDQYVGSLLREITRPLLVPHNITVGTSKDSNMASAVVDSEIYKSGQKAERIDCNEVALDKVLDLWWDEASKVSGYLGDDLLQLDNTFRTTPPRHRWRWDSIGVDHTDPSKVANAIKTLHDKKFATDRDIQERYFDRSLEDWQNEITQQEEFRQTIGGDDNNQNTPSNEPEPAEQDD